METRMKATELAKKLRGRLAELKKERVKALAQYDEDFETWKLASAKWLRTEPQKIIPRIKKSDLSNGRYGCHTSLPSFVFEGIPKAPRQPDDKIIREIQKTIRYIAFTGASTVQVSSHQLEEWFKDASEDDD